MIRHFISSAVVIAVLAFMGRAAAQEIPPLDRAAFAKEELSRRWHWAERARQDRVRKAQVDQDTYDALDYRLELDIDVENESIAGTLALTALSLAAAPANLVLDLSDSLTVSAVRERGLAATFTHENDLLTIALSQSYAVGDMIHLQIDYGGKPTGENDELGWNAFTFGRHGPDAEHRDQLVIYTLSEPYSARAWWPCKDVPDDKATVLLEVTVPDTLTVASNGTLEAENAVGGARKTYVWRESYPIATYLVSLAISNYDRFIDCFHYTTADSMDVAYFVYPEHADTAEIAFAPTVSMLEAYSDLFGLYPFIEEKYGMAEFGWGGAMEHQTCTSMGSRFLTRSTGSEWAIAHELSHQWWGDMVTPEGWADVWLNEGFATYSEALWVEHEEGFDAYQSYMVERLRPSKRFHKILYDPEQLFGYVTVYEKGAWVLHMLRHVMGSERFFDALRAYATNDACRYGNATTADFQRICEEHYEGSLSWFFEEWVYSGGEPEYAWYWTQEGKHGAGRVDVTVRQLQIGQVFSMPVDIRFSLGSGDTTITVWNDEAVDQYAFAFADSVIAVAVDPDVWVLRSVEERALPSVTLSVNPNPFNASARIAFELDVGGVAEIIVYDVTGARVRALFRDEVPAGYNEKEWDGRSESGDPVSSGVYFVSLQTPRGSLVRKAVLLK